MMMAEFVGTSNRFVDVVGPMNVSPSASGQAKAMNSAITQMDFIGKPNSGSPSVNRYARLL
jgi:hypothetical protein